MKYLLFSLLLISPWFVQSQDFAAPVTFPFDLMVIDTPASSIQVQFQDMDLDGDLDAIHSGFTGDTSPIFFIAMQENIGSATDPQFGPINDLNLDIDFPNYIMLISVADVTNDNLPDILAFGELEEITGATHVFYENTSTAGEIKFNSISADSIGLVGLGQSFFFPELVDLNLDGDVDLLCGGAVQDAVTEELDGVLYYAQNTGNLSDPSYVGWFEDPYAITFPDTFQLLIPRAGDLDLDGDIDILAMVAETDDEDYAYYYFENIASAGASPQYDVPIVDPFNLSLLNLVIPSMADLDGDGDIDLFLIGGDEETEIYYLENISCTPSTSNIELSMCMGDSVIVGNSIYYASGIYQDVLMKVGGCDSVVNLDLTINDTDTSALVASICNGEIFQVGHSSYSTPGTYQDVLQNVFGCDSVVNLDLSVIQLNTEIQLDDITLTAASGADTYQWFDCDDDIDIVGATNQSFSPSLTGNYGVRISQDGCNAESNCIFIVISSTRELHNIGVSLYPNPVSDKIIIEGIGDRHINQQAMLVNSLGEISKLSISDDATISLTRHSSGNYILILSIDEVYYSAAFIKM